jgi:RIO kinase 1
MTESHLHNSEILYSPDILHDPDILHGPFSLHDSDAQPSGVDYAETAELEPNQRWSTWDEIGILAGPEPWPDWLITADAAIDTELGILKTGKEADVFLLERATVDESVVLAAKRYRSTDHRLFHRDNSYTEGRVVRRSRDRRALAKSSTYGRTVQAGQWALAEFGYLCRFWSEGLPVPYPRGGAETSMR